MLKVINMNAHIPLVSTLTEQVYIRNITRRRFSYIMIFMVLSDRMLQSGSRGYRYKLSKGHGWFKAVSP